MTTHADTPNPQAPHADAPPADIPTAADGPHAPTLQDAAAPGWSNAPADGGISTREPAPPPNIDMSQDGFSNNGPAATGATSGTPGTWTPPNAERPNNLAAMSAIVATPARAWLTGKYVVLGDGSEAHWNNAAWVAGKA